MHEVLSTSSVFTNASVRDATPAFTNPSVRDATPAFVNASLPFIRAPGEASPLLGTYTTVVRDLSYTCVHKCFSPVFVQRAKPALC